MEDTQSMKTNTGYVAQLARSVASGLLRNQCCVPLSETATNGHSSNSVKPNVKASRYQFHLQTLYRFNESDPESAYIRMNDTQAEK